MSGREQETFSPDLLPAPGSRGGQSLETLRLPLAHIHFYLQARPAKPRGLSDAFNPEGAKEAGKGLLNPFTEANIGES